MKRFPRWLIAVALLLAVFWWVARGSGSPDIAQGSLLVIELSGSYVDGPVPLLSRLRGEAVQSLLGLTSELRKAARDERLDGVVFRVRGLDVGWAQAEEIRQAIQKLSEKGRPTLAVLEFEGFGNAPYYVASAADRVVMTPGGNSPLRRHRGGVPVPRRPVREARRGRRVRARRRVQERGRELRRVEDVATRIASMTNALIDSVEGQFIRQIAASRKRTEEQVRLAIDSAPSAPETFVEHGLIDGVATWDEALASLGEHEKVKTDVYSQVTPRECRLRAGRHLRDRARRGRGGGGRGQLLGREPGDGVRHGVARPCATPPTDPAVKAIVLRIDSPGGSPLASDLIWQAIRDVQKQGKPVVASLSDVAASGGYYVASAADAIVSQPQTLTGSIGVFVIRPVLAGLMEKLGIGIESITRGARADLLLSTVPLSAETRAVLRDDVQHTYERFLGRVAEGRGLDTRRGGQDRARARVDRRAGARDRPGGPARRHPRGGARRQGEAGPRSRRGRPPGAVPAAEAAGAAVPRGAPGRRRVARAARPAEGRREPLAVLRALPLGTPLLIGPAWIEIH